QNTYFNANCMILGSNAVRIWPNCGLATFVNAAVGTPARKLFVTLNASTRTSTRWDSLSRNGRDNATSNDHVGTYRMLFRRLFPNVPRAGTLKAAGLSQSEKAPPAPGV